MASDDPNRSSPQRTPWSAVSKGTSTPATGQPLSAPSMSPLSSPAHSRNDSIAGVYHQGFGRGPTHQRAGSGVGQQGLGKSTFRERAGSGAGLGSGAVLTSQSQLNPGVDALPESNIVAPTSFEETAKKLNLKIRTAVITLSWSPPPNREIEFKPNRAPAGMAGKHKPLAIKKGQEGFALGTTFTDATGWKWLRFCSARSDQKIATGWIPYDERIAKVVELGKEAGNVTFVDDTTQLPLPEIKAPEQMPGLERTIMGLFDAFMADRAAVRTATSASTRIDAVADKGTQIRDAILRGMPPAVKRALASGKPQLEDLFYNVSAKMGPHKVPNNQDPRTVLYILVLRNIKKGQGSSDANIMGKYCGKSIQIGIRHLRHNTEFNRSKPKGHLYNKGHGAEWRMVILSDLSDTPISIREAVVQIAEQIVVCLFDTITPVLLSGEALAGEGSLSNYVLDCLAAKRFQEIQTRVFAETGWQPPRGVGLNWQSPLTENMIGFTVWTCQVVPLDDGGNVLVYTRGPLKAGSSFEGGPTIYLLTGGKDHRAIVKLSGLPSWIKTGDYVIPTVEIYTSDRRHPFSYANCTEPGAWSDSELQNKVAIRLTRKDADCEKTEWVQYTRTKYFEPIYEHQYVNALYVRVQRIYNALRQVEYNVSPSNQLPKWLHMGPKISIKVLQYDHLKQELRLVEQKPLRLPVPYLRSFEENTVNLYNMYGPDLMYGDDGRPEKGLYRDDPGRPTEHCSICMPIWKGQQPLAHNANGYQCTRVATPNSQGKLDSCEKCFMLRRPCVWIPGVDLLPVGGRWEHSRIPHWRKIEPYVTESRPDMGATAEEVEDENGEDEVDVDDGLD